MPATRIALDKKIGADTTIDPKALQLGNVAVAELVARIAIKVTATS
ncbi:MAG: hypothetical protein Q8R67_15050 [Rhodoferax sp.]|nr:hypothetical protein [Rhodoferax sp.]MDP3652994.1 hypothetical protein [Rhodoferax sp.]